jgi:hypothetical protein
VWLTSDRKSGTRSDQTPGTSRDIACSLNMGANAFKCCCLWGELKNTDESFPHILSWTSGACNPLASMVIAQWRWRLCEMANRHASWNFLGMGGGSWRYKLSSTSNGRTKGCQIYLRSGNPAEIQSVGFST